MWQWRRHGGKGFTLIELLIAIAVIGILAAIALPNLQGARRRSQYTRAASDTKTAVTQAVMYQNDHAVYPGTLSKLRADGYTNVADRDPWGTDWVTTALFRATAAPLPTGELHVCSEGPTRDAPDCDPADLPGTLPSGTQDGGIGYSATYGSWQGK